MRSWECLRVHSADYLLPALHDDGARCGSTNDFGSICTEKFIYMSYANEACECVRCENAFSTRSDRLVSLSNIVLIYLSAYSRSNRYLEIAAMYVLIPE